MKTVVLAALAPLMVACSGCGGSGPGSRHGILFIRQAHNSGSWDPQGPVYIWQHGSSPHRLSQSEDAKDRPQWSPNGRLIAYTAIQGWNGQGACQTFACKFEIWVMRSDGTDSKQLTAEGEPNSIGADAPSWSPDGMRIVYMRILASSPTQLVILTVRVGTRLVIEGHARRTRDSAWAARSHLLERRTASQRLQDSARRAGVRRLVVARWNASDPRCGQIRCLRARPQRKRLASPPNQADHLQH